MENVLSTAVGDEATFNTVYVRVSSLPFSDGVNVPIPREGVVLFVGPNNAGKSQSLKDLIGYAREESYLGRTLKAPDFIKEVNGSIESWIDDTIPKGNRDGLWKYHVPGWGEIGMGQIISQWSQPRLTTLTGLFMLHADGTSRLTAGDSQPSLDFSLAMPSHPVQRAYQDTGLEVEIDRESRSAFGMGVTVDRYGGSVISLRLGDRPTFTHDLGRPSDDYLRELKKLPKLEDQGDGVRSYLGLLLHVVAGSHQVLLIDEPEAFLHPPQARRLGTLLAGQPQGQQAFIATHSSDVVRGALESESTITIVRITREGDVNHPAVLVDEAVKKLWSDPLLRYSSVLDGLFHDAVVLCESDADCRYYAAVLDGIAREESKTGGSSAERDPQLLFTHCGGKARMASVVEALRAVSVPVIVVADFDVLRHASDVQNLVRSLGGNFADVEADLKVVAAALGSDAKPLRKTSLKDAVVARIDDLPQEVLNQRDVDSVRALVKVDTGWDKAKRSGVSAVPQGAAHQACQRLLSQLQDLRLMVVPVGELERFVPGVGGHGPAWVTDVLEQKQHESPTVEARTFVEKIRRAAAS